MWMSWRESVHARRVEAVGRERALGVFGTGMAPDDVISGDEVRIYGELDPYFGIDAWALAPRIRDLDAEEVQVRIDSPGGFVTDGILLYNALADLSDSGTRVVVTVDAMAASAASFLAMAGDTIRMGRGARLMVHAPWGAMAGTAPDLRAMADELDRLTVELAEIYKARAGGRIDSWVNLLNDGDTFFSAREAVAKGLADEVVDLKRRKDDEPKNELTVTAPKAVLDADVEDPPAEDAAAVEAAACDLARQRALATAARAALAVR
jgi:ATP-dependent protease ClpP protease subunit